MANPDLLLSWLHTLVEATANLGVRSVRPAGGDPQTAGRGRPLRGDGTGGIRRGHTARRAARSHCTAGGILRDVVCNEIPTALRDCRPYAVCAFVGGWAYVVGVYLGLAPGLAFVLAAAMATGLRVWALVSGYELPAGGSVVSGD